MLELTEAQYNLVYNSFSLVIAAMGASFIFFLLARGSLPAKHRMAVTLSALVVAIAGYHYFRIFDSWESAFTLVGDRYVQDGAFNEGYRYVDWLLTVPLLLAELVVVLKLTSDKTRSLLVRLIVAAIAMIALGYPGELSPADSAARTIWGVLSTIPFLYIVWVLFVELGRSLGRQSPRVAKIVGNLRFLLLASWGVYPLAYLAPSVIDDAAVAEVTRQVGYSFADIVAKPVFGLLILFVATIKASEDRAATGDGHQPEALTTGNGTSEAEPATA